MSTLTSPDQPTLPRFLRASWLHPLNDRQALEEILADLDPMWSLGTVRARLIERRTETADTCTLRLQPNRWWRGFKAGQHLSIGVEIDGVRRQRVYSLSSSATQGGWIEITVKRQAGGLVSNFLNEQLPLGAVLELGPASGDFNLPAPLPEAGLLLIAAGSGITPMRSLLAELEQRLPASAAAGSVVLLQVCREPADRIFGAELDALAARWPQLRILPWYTQTQGRPSAAQLLATVPDHAQRAAYLCGPAGFMQDLEQHWQQLPGVRPLQLERFGAAPAQVDEQAAVLQVRGNSAEQSFSSRAGAPLLSEAERAGLTPQYGCRIGICRSCQCRKRSGTVQDLVSGQISSQPNEWIRLCVSSARSDLELDL